MTTKPTLQDPVHPANNKALPGWVRVWSLAAERAENGVAVFQDREIERLLYFSAWGVEKSIEMGVQTGVFHPVSTPCVLVVTR